MAAMRNLELEGFGDETEVEAAYDNEIVDVPEYWITSYGIDYDVAGIVRRLQNGDIEIPPYQRGLVWDIARASRFIESLLLRLPVPGIFLYRKGDSQKQQVIDGQQRLRTLQSYYEGSFAGEEFALTEVQNHYQGLTYEDLSAVDRRKLDDASIHATIIRQDKPDDGGSSQYAIFERINTTATPLEPQEIRAAIYPGEFNRLLAELNDNPDWRALFGKKHKRQRDKELILRFFALYYWANRYRRPMKGFLNDFMSANRDQVEVSGDKMRSVFEDTVNVILTRIDKDAFRLKYAVNGALCDAVMVGVARRLCKGRITKSLMKSYKELVDDQEFIKLLDVRTSSTQSVTHRLEMATQAFEDAE